MPNVPAPNLNTLSVSPELWQLLSEGSSENTRIIANTESLKAEAARASRSLAVAAEAAGPQYLQRALAPLVLIYGLGDQASSPAFWRVYNEVLADYPRIALDRAVSQWQGEGLFFPKPAELKAIAKPHADALRQAVYRCEEAQKDEVQEQPNKRDQRTPQSMAQVGRMMADYAKMIQTKTPPRPVTHPVRGPVDEQGVTEAGRALIERMRGYAPY